MLLGGNKGGCGYLFIGKSLMRHGSVIEFGWGWRSDAAEGEVRWRRNYTIRLRSPVRFRRYPDGLQVTYFGRSRFMRWPNVIQNGG